MSSLSFLTAEYTSLAAETKRKHPEVREAVDQALTVLRTNPSVGSLDGKTAHDLLQPVFLACHTKTAKVIALGLGSLQRLVMLRAVPEGAIPEVISIMREVLAQGVEIQLKILQTLLSLVSNVPAIHGDELAECLLLCFRLQESKIAVVSSTASATLMQLVLNVFDRVSEEDKRSDRAHEAGEDSSNAQPSTFIDLPDGSSFAVGPAARDAHLLFQDLCALCVSPPAVQPPTFLKLTALQRTFDLELIESALTNHYVLFRRHPHLLNLLQANLCPLLLRALAEPPAFPTTLRLTRVVFLLLKQFSAELMAEGEVFWQLIVRFINGESADEGGRHLPGWVRVLAMEISRGLCSDAVLMRTVYTSYDASPSASDVFASLVAALNRIATEKASLLGVGTQMHGVGVSPPSASPSASDHHAFSYMGEMAAMVGGVASAAASGVAGMMGAEEAGLSVGNAMKLQCIDQRDKAEAPSIPETYPALLALQCLTSLCEGFASLVLPLYTSAAAARPRAAGEPVVRASPSLDLSSLPSDDPARTVHAMASAGWPALLAGLSFFLSTNLDDELFASALHALQSFAQVCGALDLSTPRDAFLATLCRAAIPSGVVAAIASWSDAPPQTPRSPAMLSVESLGGLAAMAAGSSGSGAGPPGLSERNLACLRCLLAVAHHLAGNLGPSWFQVLEALQNADFVLRARARAASTQRRVVSNPSSGAGASSNTSAKRVASAASSAAAAAAATSSSDSAARRRPALLADLDVDAIQAGIARLFEASKSLDDAAFRSFVGALCRLSGEMVDMRMSEDGEELHEGAGTPVSPDPGVAAPPPHRRRASGISVIRTLRSGETSFGISKIGTVAQLNLHRLIYRDPDAAWNVVTRHLLSVIAHVSGPQAIRIQAADVLNELLAVAPRNATSAPELQARVQRRVLEALLEQVAPRELAPRQWTSAEAQIREKALQTLFKVLESAGHAFVGGWESIFEILRAACAPVSASRNGKTWSIAEEVGESEGSTAGDTAPTSSEPRTSMSTPTKSRPTSLGPAQRPSRNPNLVRVAFACLNLVCTDFLSALSPDELELCISTLTDFGHQPDDLNICLTASHLLWNVSDYLQARRKEDAANERRFTQLWMMLLDRLRALAEDPRPEVRNGAIQTLFRSIDLYGASLDEHAWNDVVWKIVFPLLDQLDAGSKTASTPSPVIHPQPTSEPLPPPSAAASWDDSKTLTLHSVATVLHAYLASKLVHLSSFPALWDRFLRHVAATFSNESRALATSALQALGKVLSAGKAVGDEPWERAWKTWDDMGEAVLGAAAATPATSEHGARAEPYTQENLCALVDVVRPIHAVAGAKWELRRIERMLKVLKGLLTYPLSRDYRPDVDVMTPLQTAVVDVVMSVDLSSPPGASALVLADLAEFGTLPFLGAFDYTDGTTVSVPGGGTAKTPPRRVTYVALCKDAMPRVVELFRKHKGDREVVSSGALEKMLGAYGIPMKLKYDVPPASKFGDDPPLWKTATLNFIQLVRDAVQVLDTMERGLPAEQFEAIWRQIVDVFRGNLQADCSPVQAFPLSDQAAEEDFDLAVLATLEADIFPRLGNTAIPDDLVVQLATVLQRASRPYVHDPDMHADGVNGSVAPLVEAPRERFAYWCFDLLFAVCSDAAADQEPPRRRVAALCLPALLERCTSVLSAYVAEAPLRGKMPFPRVREEELHYVLRKLYALRLYPGTLHAAFSDNPSGQALNPSPLDVTAPAHMQIRNVVSRSPVAHLFHAYRLFTELLVLPTTAPVAPAPSQPTSQSWRRRSLPKAGPLSAENAVENGEKDKVAGERLSVKELARRCLVEVGTAW